jgi:undecaprenyl-diphosphatase
LEALLELDKNIFVFLNSLGSTKFDIIWMFITDKKSSIPLYIFLLVFLFKKTKNK